MRGNQLSDLPEDLSPLANLSSLNLLDNKLSVLPEDLLELDYLYELSLDKNPLEGPEASAAQAGIPALRDYLRQRREQETLPVYEAKLLIVGEAAAGKTTLMKKLADPTYPVPNPADRETLGINVLEGWRFPYARDKNIEFRANIWDFGGQEIQYATHQFFLTAKALYVLVADDRRQDTDFDYWLKVIHLLGEGSPALVFLHEKQGKPVSGFNLGAYQKRFPELHLQTEEARTWPTTGTAALTCCAARSRTCCATWSTWAIGCQNSGCPSASASPSCEGATT